MANFVATSLDIIRRHKPRQPHLHSRWGDVAITAPVEGAWSQIDSQYLEGDQKYGPGFVPGVDIDDKEVMLIDPCINFSDDEIAADEEKRSSTSSRSQSLKEDPRALSKAQRLTRILLPSSVNTPVKKSATEFQYMPVNPNYAQEVAEQVSLKSKPGFRYVPASKHYLRELRTDFGRNEDKDHRHCESDDDADDEQEGKGNINRIKKHHQKEPARSHSCEPYMSGRSVAGTAERRKPRSRTGVTVGIVESPKNRKASLPENVPAENLSRKVSVRAGSTSRLGQHDHDHASSHRDDQARGRFARSGTSPIPVIQRSKSTTASKLHRRTMTLEMVGDQEDLW